MGQLRHRHDPGARGGREDVMQMPTHEQLIKKFEEWYGLHIRPSHITPDNSFIAGYDKGYRDGYDWGLGEVGRHEQIHSSASSPSLGEYMELRKWCVEQARRVGYDSNEVLQLARRVEKFVLTGVVPAPDKEES